MLLPAGALLVVTFFVSAKAHGRQLRLEREQAGYHEVTFGGENPPFVEALWRRDRVRYWSVALPIVGAWVVVALRSRPVVARAAPLVGMTVAFVALGLASAARLRARGGGSGGSARWWALVGACAFATAVAAAL